MRDLDNLRPEVREVIFEIECRHNVRGWKTVRAELLRLARENDEWQARCLQFQRERDKAQAELAAVKARIAEAPRADGQRVFDLLCLPIEFDGTLALVKVEE